MLLECSVGA